MSESTVYYRVLYDYEHAGEATNDKYLSIRAGDVIEVELVHAQNVLSNGWLYGRQQSTHEVGLFPASYVEKQLTLPKPMPRNRLKKHCFEIVYFRLPVICSHCSDYIWGEGKVGVKCTSCKQFYHNSCQGIAVPCTKKATLKSPDVEVYSDFQSITNWDKYEVKKWMAVVNLHRYSEIFSSHNITGHEMLGLDTNKIKGMNIKDEFHIEAILTSIGSLKKSQDTNKGIKTTHGEFFPHDWSVYTFTSLQVCHVCREFLYGIVQQGYQCQVCGLCCHRKCSFSCHLPCDVNAMKALRRPSFNSDSMFGRHLAVFMDIPPVLVLCANYLESKGSDLLNYYRKTPATSEVNLLKSMFDKNPSSLDLSSFECPVVGGVMKKFLRDLPDPVIPETFYASFIQLDERNVEDLVDSLPQIHKSTLIFLICHFRKDRADNLNKLARIFNQILMRPPWTRIMDIIDNSKVQTKCIDLLLRMPAIDTSIVFGSHSGADCIISAPWYWEDISKEEVNEKMMNSLDGTYLVRNSTNKEENAPYTLTLRKNYKNMLIKIYHSHGKYGLMEPLVFNTVDDLIRHYSNVSLVEFNSSLDLKLQFPVERSIERTSEMLDIVKLRCDFKVLCERHSELEEELQSLHGREETLSEECKVKQAAISAYEQVMAMYKEHAEIALKFRSTGDLTRLSTENFEMLNNKKFALDDIINDVMMELEKSEGELENIRMKLEEKKMEMIKCTQDKNHKELLLEKCGETSENIALIKEGKEVVSRETVPHLNESLWLLARCDRNRAEVLLEGRSVGTFLIRRRIDKDSYALSIVSPDKDGLGSSVVHCLIDRKGSGYGFAEPFYIHRTLLDLVLHYKETSLIEHNDILNVTLKFPVFYSEPV